MPDSFQEGTCKYVRLKCTFDIIMCSGALITMILLRIILGELSIVSATEATHIIGERDPLVLAA